MNSWMTAWRFFVVDSQLSEQRRNGPFSLTGAVELGTVERSGFVESRHAGPAVVFSPEGDVIRQLGETTAAVFARSCLKPFQALAVMTSGIVLRGVDAAIAPSSHTGTVAHVELVRKLLARENIPENALGCPRDEPSDATTREALIRTGASATSPLYISCSGKHAAMLLACVANDWPLAGYLEPEHPVQKRILDVITRFTGERPDGTGIDGCGAPVYAITLRGLARGIQKVTQSQASSPFAIHREAAALTEAVRENSWAVAGPGQPDTIAISRLGVFAKSGAEGLVVMSAANGTTAAVKVLDGSSRASALVALWLLAHADAISYNAVDEVYNELDLWVMGGERRVGKIRPSVKLGEGRAARAKPRGGAARWAPRPDLTDHHVRRPQLNPAATLPQVTSPRFAGDNFSAQTLNLCP